MFFLLGGRFGGKETHSCLFSTAVAVAANKYDCMFACSASVTKLYRLQVPIRQMLDRNEDMRTTGTCHPYLGRYKVANQSTILSIL